MSDAVGEYGPRYPARKLLDLVGDKWTPVVLFSLSDSVKRFGELQRDIPDISKKMLTQVLRALERGGLVTRTVHDTVPPKTEYQLTPDGHILHEPVAALCNWATDHEEFLDRIRTRSSIAGKP